jgi:hypothetical protein
MDWVDPSAKALSDDDGDTRVVVEATPDEDFIRLSTAGTEHMTIDDTGLVGIGTVTPQSKLEVSSVDTRIKAITTGTSLTGYPKFVGDHEFGGTNPVEDVALVEFGGVHQSSEISGMLVATDQDWSATAKGTNLQFYTTENNGTARSEAMRIDNAGLVGIGTATPTVPLDVNGEGDFRTVYISDNTSVASTISMQGTAVIDDGDWAADASNTQWYFAKLSDNTTARSGTNQVVITDTGNLGLGTNAPDD